MKQAFEYHTVRALLGAARYLPRKSLYALARQITERSYAPGSRRDERILQHLAIAFPEMNLESRREIAARYRWHKAHFYVEMVLMLTGRFDYEKSVVNLEEARERIARLKEQNRRGMVFLVSHYGNWEFLAQFFAVNGLPGTLVAKAQSRNPLIDEKIIQPYRKGFGHRVVERRGALRSIAKILRDGGGVGMHIDQMIPPPNGVLIDFFGRPAYASKSMAQLKLRFDPLMIPIFASREGKEAFRILIDEPVEYKAQEYESAEKKIQAMTQRYTGILENRIIEDPAQWEWAYRRWRMPKEANASKTVLPVGDHSKDIGF